MKLLVLSIAFVVACGSKTSTPADPKPAPVEPTGSPAPASPDAGEPADLADPDDIPILPTDSPERAEAKRKMNETRRERDRLERESQGAGSSTP